MYCKEFGVAPYKGDYGSHPAKWVDKVFIIKNMLSRLEQQSYDNIKKESMKNA
jgi:hypothetical protein